MHAALGLLLLVGLLGTVKAVEVPSDQQDGKIVNGTTAGLGEFPYAVSMLPKIHLQNGCISLFFYPPFSHSLRLLSTVVVTAGKEWTPLVWRLFAEPLMGNDSGALCAWCNAGAAQSPVRQ